MYGDKYDIVGAVGSTNSIIWLIVSIHVINVSVATSLQLIKIEWQQNSILQ